MQCWDKAALGIVSLPSGSEKHHPHVNMILKGYSKVSGRFLQINGNVSFPRFGIKYYT
jgi:hypothetical protein